MQAESPGSTVANDERLSSHIPFNHSLFDAYQSILCADAAAPETQEHIVSSLASAIEERGADIGSGWRPLFDAVKAVHVVQGSVISL